MELNTESTNVISELESEAAEVGNHVSQDGEKKEEHESSFNTASPSPVEDAQRMDGESPQQESQHAPSSLEGINELEEVDERGDELHWSPPKEEAGEHVGVPSRVSSAPPVISTFSHGERVRSATADLSRFHHGPIKGLFSLECHKNPRGQIWEDDEEAGTPSESGDLCGRDASSAESPSLRHPENLQLQKESQPAELSQLSEQLKDSNHRIRELENDLNSERKRSESHASKIQQLENRMSSGSLIDVLTKCKSKVEQLEELKSSSRDLRVQLQAAQGAAAFLQRRLLSLEEEQDLKQQQVVKLSRELQDTRRALRERGEEVTRVTAQLHNLQQETERKRGSGAEPLANGNVTGHREASKVCTLL